MVNICFEIHRFILLEMLMKKKYLKKFLRYLININFLLKIN